MAHSSPNRIFQQNLAVRYLAVAAAFLALILLLLGAFQVYTSYREELREIDAATDIQSEFLASVSVEHVLTNNFFVLERLVRQTHRNPDIVYALILDNDGRPLTRWVDSDNPYIARVLADEKPADLLALIESVNSNSEVRSKQQEITLEDRVHGRVWLGYSLAAVNQGFWQSALTTLLTTLATIVLLAGLTFVVFHLLIGRRLQRMAAVADEFAAGNYQRRAEGETNDEIGRLTVAFNRMADRLQETVQGLHAANEEAEAANVALRKSESEARKLSHVASRTSNMVIISDAWGTIEWVNEGFERTTGYRLDDVVGHRPGQLLQGPATDPDVVAYMSRQLKAQQPFNAELVNYSKTGEAYWVAIDVAPVHDDDGAVINFVAVETDISERKRTEEIMRQRIQLDTLISEVSADLITCRAEEIDEKIVGTIEHLAHELALDFATLQLYDPAKPLVLETQSTWMVEALAAAALPAPAIEVDPDSWWSSNLAAGTPIVAESILAFDPYPAEIDLLLEGAVFRSVLAMPVAWGGQHRGQFIMGTVFAEHAWSEETVAAMTLVADIFASALQRKQIDMALERERASLEKRTSDLNTANAALAEASKAKDAFWANMSHELRTPLNVILGYTQLMERDPNLSAQQETHLGVIEKSGNHLLTLINDVLSLSKIEAGRMTLTTAPFDLHEMLTNLERMFAPRMAKKRLAFAVERAENLPRYIETDEGKIRQVLLNLLDNALKFTDQGSVQVQVDYNPGNRHLYFSVTDTGIGIDADELDQLFEHFTQTESGRQSKSGTGLGLALSRQFVRMMGGDIIVNSVPHQGTSFIFDVVVDLVTDVAVEEAVDRRRIVAIHTNADRPLRVMVAEDLPDNQHFMLQILEAVDAEVQIAANGREAVSLVEAMDPDIILMDLRMPEMDGYEATRQIRALPGFDGIPIIAVTASALDYQRNHAIEAGCTDVLYKPVQVNALFQMMAKYLDVELAYAVQAEEEEAEATPAATEADFAVLPPDLRAELHRAAVLLDTDRMHDIVERIGVDHAETARQLNRMIDEFDLEQIIELSSIDDV